jgi:hypothetical protein
VLPNSSTALCRRIETTNESMFLLVFAGIKPLDEQFEYRWALLCSQSVYAVVPSNRIAFAVEQFFGNTLHLR